MKKIHSDAELNNAVNSLVETIQEVLSQEIPTHKTLSIYEKVVDKGAYGHEEREKQAE